MINIFFKGNGTYSLVNKSLDNVVYYGSPADLRKNGLLKILMRIHLSKKMNSIFELPFKRIWNKTFKIINKRFPDDKKCFIFDAHYYWILKSGAAEYIRQKLKSYVCFFFNDKFTTYSSIYKKFPSVDIFQKKSDLVLTYNELDSKKYGIKLINPIIKDYSWVNFDDRYKTDLFFVGKEKGRLDDLINIYDKCTNEGLTCIFYIVDVSKNKQINRQNIFYNTRISYKENLLFSKNTRCLINLVQKDGEGFTLRDSEAVFFGKNLLTDNKYLQKIDCFDTNQIIWFDKNFSEKNVKSLLKSEFHSNPIVLKKYSEESFYNWLDIELQKK